MIMKKIIILIVIVLLHMPAWATDYTVGPSGGYDYTGSNAILNCINAQSGGGTCNVYNGTYSGGSITASGADLDNMIIAQAATDQTSITITSAFQFGTQDYIRIGEVGSGFTINSGSFTCSPGGSYIQIIGNHFNTGSTVATGMECHDWMISDNTMSGSAHNGTDVYQLNQAYDRSDVYNVVWRNNVMGSWTSDSSNHVDFIQDGCWGGNDHGWFLIEGNTFYDITGSDQHFFLANCQNASDSSYWILRYNIVSNVSQGLATSGPSSGGSTYSNWVVYNNTVSEGGSSGRYWWTYSDNVSGTVGAPNNLVYDSMDITWNVWGVYLSPGICHGNLYYDPDGTQGVDGDSCYTGASGVLANVDPEFSDPSFASSLDFSLDTDSQAVNGGVHLTLADGSGSSTTALTVDDPIYFQDGWAGINPDCIAIGTVGNTACIVRDSINYATGAITLDTALTWSDAASVWLYKKSDGEIVLYGDAPDIGAEEYVSGDSTSTILKGSGNQWRFNSKRWVLE